MNNLTIRHKFRNLGDDTCKYYATSFFIKLFDKLKILYPDIVFDIDECKQYESMGYGALCSCMHLSILNPSNNKYILVSLFDNWKYHFNKVLGWDPDNMVQFFYAGSFDFLDFYAYKSFISYNKDYVFPNHIHKTYQQFFYIPCYDCLYNELKDLFSNRSNRQLDPSLFFRGYLWDSRKLMLNNIADAEDIVIIDKNTDTNNLNYNQFVKELSGYKASLSLPGGTNICHRDIESFAVGTPVFRPLLTTNYPDPLLPNYHYMCFYGMCDYSDDHNPTFLSYKDFQEHLLYWWNKLKNNNEYLDYISHNARNWFEQHCTMDNNIEYVLSKINMEALNG
jgi:hypothetical protein